MDRKHALAECERCPLAGPENTFVPTKKSSGPPTLVVVGEAPGHQEAMYGQPFVGPSGQLIKKVLKHYKYKPSEVTFTNACLCRPPGNATPPKAAVNACRERLMGELAASGAHDVLALGGTAVTAVVDDSRSITHLRVGPPKSPTFALRETSVQRVVPTWHPAYCLRNPDAFPTLVSDVGKLREKRFGQWKPPTWVHAEELEHAMNMLDDVMANAEYLVIDIEVGVEKDNSFIHPNLYSMLCVGLQYKKGVAYVIGEEPLKNEEVVKRLGEVLRTKKLIAHNGKFDLEGLFPLVGVLELFFDTMLAHYALDERPGTHGLKVLAVERLGAPKYDDEILQYVPRGGNYSNIPRPILYKYNAYDVSCTWDLFELFVEALDREDLRRVHDFMVRASNQLMFLELNGIAIDRAYSDRLESEYITELTEYEARFNEIVSRSTLTKVTAEDGTVTHEPKIKVINPRSPKQIREYYLLHGFQMESTDVEHLTNLLTRLAHGTGVRQFTERLLEYRRRQKLYGTFIKGIRSRTYRGRVYTTYLLHGSTSGRLASRNPNLQNIVRDKRVRQQFSVSAPDNVLIQFDYKQSEGRVIATLAQDTYLQSIFADNDRDIFNELSDQLYGVGKWDKDKRVRTKALFYGIGYGRTAYSLALEHGWNPQEAEAYYRDFMDLIPATAAWQREIKRLVMSGEVLTTPFGRKRRFHLITNENQRDVLNEALSFLPQSTSSDICLSALITVRPLLRGIGWLRLTIHDALVAECPRSNLDQVSSILRQEMLAAGKAFTDFVPFEVDSSIGTHWGML